MSAEGLANGNLSDEILVELIVRRDLDAFVALYERYAPPVYALASYLLGHDQAEEACQEIFLILWQRAYQYDPLRGPFRPWFMAIGRNHILGLLRRRKREQRISAALNVEHALLGLPDDGIDLELDATLRAESHEMLAALRQLPAEQRTVLVLAYFGGLSQKEIARETQAPLGTVKKRTKLGLDKLRKMLRREPAEEQRGSSDQDKSETVRHDL